METMSLENLKEIDNHILCAVSGHIADARALVDYARSESLMHSFTYNEQISIPAITQAVSDLALNFGEGDMTNKRKPIARPYGVVLLVAGVDENGPQLYQVEPSGTMIGYMGRIIGPADERQNFLAEHYKPVIFLILNEIGYDFGGMREIGFVCNERCY